MKAHTRQYAEKIIADLEVLTGESIRDELEIQRIYSVQDFQEDYHAFKGTALGLAHTLRQTAIFRPSMRNKKLKNLFYAGQYTHPGVGIPMTFIAADLVSKIVKKAALMKTGAGKKKNGLGFSEFREGVAEEIRRLLPALFEQYHALNNFSPILLKRLEDYALRGKLMRGCLVPFTYYNLPGRELLKRDLYSIAATMELLQSMLLIHDDIMDQDELRRGGPAIHAIYGADGKREGVRNFRHYGESMGICVGDVASLCSLQYYFATELRSPYHSGHTPSDFRRAYSGRNGPDAGCPQWRTPSRFSKHG